MSYQNNYEWLGSFCLEQPYTTTDVQPEWNNATRYFVGGKMFAMFHGDKYGKPVFTVKLEPFFGNLLRQQYSCIIPGYHMNKEHWNSLYLDGDAPDDTVRAMVQDAYRLVFNSLSKKTQKELLGGSNNG